MISMEVTPFTTQAVFVDPFPGNLKTIFLEEDAISAEVTKADEEDKGVWIDTKQSVLVNVSCQEEVSEPVKDTVLDENTSMSAKSTDYAEVSANPVGTEVIIPNTTVVYDLSGGDVGSPTKNVCRLDDLGAKSLQPKCPQIYSNSLVRSINQPLLQFRRWSYRPVLSSSGVQQ